MTAEEIILAVMAEKKISRANLCYSRCHGHLRMRRIAITRMRKAGFGVTEIAVALDRPSTTISYWMNGGGDRGRFRATETNSIVIQVCNEHQLYPAEFFGNGRDKRLTAARREAIQRLKAAGFNGSAIAGLLRLSYDAVRYWMNDGYREYHRRVARASLARSKQAEVRA